MQNSLAVISDIPSNFEALMAVLDDVKAQEVRQIVWLGDIVGYATTRFLWLKNWLKKHLTAFPECIRLHYQI